MRANLAKACHRDAVSKLMQPQHHPHKLPRLQVVGHLYIVNAQPIATKLHITLVLAFEIHVV